MNAATTADQVTAALAEHLTSIRTRALPAMAEDRGVGCLIDALACMIGGTAVPEVRAVAALPLSWGGAAEARVPGFAGRYPAPHAAYAMATLGNALDFDDTILGVGHPGASIVAASLAVGQRVGASGGQVLRAIVAGYEAAVRIGRALTPTPERARRVRGQPALVFGPAAACATLLGLESPRMAQVLGLAALHAPVPFVGKWYERPISWAKNNYGWVALGGVTAGLLADQGIPGNQQILDGENGFWAMAASDRWEPSAVLADLGEEFAVCNTAFKAYPACRYTHEVLDALDRLAPALRGRVEDVEEVVVEGGAQMRVFGDYAPASLIDGQFSLPFLAAAALLGQHLSADLLRDAAAERLAARVRISASGNERQGLGTRVPATRVRVVLRDGRDLRVACQAPSAPDLDAKLLALAEPVLGSSVAREMLERARTLPTLARVADLLEPADRVWSRPGAPPAARTVHPERERQLGGRRAGGAVKVNREQEQRSSEVIV